MPFGYSKHSNGRGGSMMPSLRALNAMPTKQEKPPLNSSGQWCTSSFDRPPGNAGWGSVPSMPSSSGDHNGSWVSQTAHSSGSGWGPPSTWSPHGATSVRPTAGASYQAKGNMYPPDHGNGGWAPPSHPPRAMNGWDSSLMQPGHGPIDWDAAPPFYETNAPSYGTQAPPSHYPPSTSTSGWPTEASFQLPQQPAATPVTSQHSRRRTPEPAIGAGPPAMHPPSGLPQPRPPATVLPGSGVLGPAGDLSQKPPQRVTTDTRVVCGPLSRLAALPADSRRWLVLLARLEEAPAAGGPSRRFTVREPDGTRTECIYYELERPLPALQPGKWVRCVGRLDGRGVFVCVTARPAARQDIGLHRQLQQLAVQPPAAGGDN